MSPALSVAAGLSPSIRQDIGIQVLSRSQPISHLAATHQVSRKFIYQQSDKAQQSLDESFAPTPEDDKVLFHLPVTKSGVVQTRVTLFDEIRSFDTAIAYSGRCHRIG